jgi:DeoR/GlpR family transcriptional regulator of sugar metabolism
VIHERRSRIADLVKEKGIVRIADLAVSLGVSEITIHRDLEFLQNQGILTKLRGGAKVAEAETEVQYPFRSQTSVEEKRQIAAVAGTMINDGDVVVIDGSTTCVEVAKRLRGRTNLTVFTNNPFILNELMGSPGVALYFFGGLFSRDYGCFVGAEVEAAIGKLHPIKGIMGASAISAEFGITGPSPQLVAIQKVIIAVAKESIVVADHTKFGKVGLEKAANLEDVTTIITDSAVDRKIAKTVSDKTRLIIAGPEETAGRRMPMAKK